MRVERGFQPIKTPRKKANLRSESAQKLVYLQVLIPAPFHEDDCAQKILDNPGSYHYCHPQLFLHFHKTCGRLQYAG